LLSAVRVQFGQNLIFLAHTEKAADIRGLSEA
jgi:hypothetical protein